MASRRARYAPMEGGGPEDAATATGVEMQRVEEGAAAAAAATTTTAEEDDLTFAGETARFSDDHIRNPPPGSNLQKLREGVWRAGATARDQLGALRDPALVVQPQSGLDWTREQAAAKRRPVTRRFLVCCFGGVCTLLLITMFTVSAGVAKLNAMHPEVHDLERDVRRLLDRPLGPEPYVNEDGEVVLNPDRVMQDLSAYVREAMDLEADPCADFYEYACGRWLRDTTVPSEESSWSRSFSTLHEANTLRLWELLTEDWPLVSQFYRNCANESELERVGVTPLVPWLGEIREVRSAAALSRTLGRLHRSGRGGLFAFGVGVDDRHPDRYTPSLWQAVGGLPSRDYYFDTDPRTLEQQQEYQQHMLRVLRLAYDRMRPVMPPAAQHVPAQTAVPDEIARAVFRFERALAEHALSPVQQRDPQATYNPYDSLQAFAATEGLTQLDWTAYADGLGTKVCDADTHSTAAEPCVRSVVVGTPGYFRAMDAVLAAVEPALDDPAAYEPAQLDERGAPEAVQQYDRLMQMTEAEPPRFSWTVVQTYLYWQVLRADSFALPQVFRDEQQRWGEYFLGRNATHPRWRQCVDATNGALGDLLGRLFVQRRFPPSAKTAAERMVTRLERAFTDTLGDLTWLQDATTRQHALQKLEAITNKIGYPKKWRGYERLFVEPRQFFRNLDRLAALQTDWALERMYQAVDRTEWEMSPAAVNAYYEPTRNEIVFPAGILQPPFFNASWPRWHNYGAMGAVIGHEITHGFDDQGRQYDADGQLKVRR